MSTAVQGRTLNVSCSPFPNILGVPQFIPLVPSIQTDPNTPKAPFLCFQELFPTPVGWCPGTVGQSHLPEEQFLHAGALQPPSLFPS